MRSEEQFDSFYLKTRRALVHQTFALTGDLAAAQHAVRDAYVQAWHHWRKVKGYDNPADWVRPRAWAQAQRRHTTRLWQRTRDLSAEDRRVLGALHKLPVAERRALVMVLVAAVPPEVGARELNVTLQTLEHQLQSATAGFAAALDSDVDSILEPLTALSGAAANTSLPRAAAIRRDGRARRRFHTFAAAGAVTFLAVGTGAFAHEPAGQAPEAGPLLTAPEEDEQVRDQASQEPDSTLPSAHDLLAVGGVRVLDPKAEWRITDTHDNTSGEGLNYACQRERFADPDGLATLVRELETEKDRPVRSVVQAVEISETEDDAAATYRTVLSWFAGCEGNVHLRRTFDVEGAADDAVLIELESWARPRTSYSVALAKLGQVVTTSVVRTVGGAAPAPRTVARTLGAATRSICERAGDAKCGARPRLEYTVPPPSEEAPGILATVDMPPLVRVGRPWVGTDPEPVKDNLAATSCDRTNFRKEGAVRGRTRTFLVPQAKLPARFGLTETYGTFKTPEAAAGFMRTVRGRFGKCEDRDLATEVLSPRAVAAGRLRGNTWRLRTELSENEEVVFDVGFVRHGATVAQLTFVPASGADLAPGAFRGLVVRAGQRLAELD